VSDEDDYPVASGLIALVAVAVVVGILAGIGALAATRLVGIGGDSGSSSGDVRGGQSLYLPPIAPTQRSHGPLVTLAPSDTSTPTTTENDYFTETPTETKTKLEPAISLTAGSNQVASNQELMISGTYVGGEGSVLDIYYNVNNAGWTEFPLDTNVSGGIFQTYVQTYKTGIIKWRVQDSSTNRVSNVVTVHHGG
jgi:hypothetical protein